MEDFFAYYTKDGSVGLYSKSDNDVYHSVYGALSEAYEKFILPINIDSYFDKTNINVLDICYGIGYNSKSFLNYFFDNFSQKKMKNFSSSTECISKIDTDNILKNKVEFDRYNEEIDTNNILCKNDNNISNEKENFENENNINLKNEENNSTSDYNSENFIKNAQIKYDINIDAIDINPTLIKLSPFFKDKSFWSIDRNNTGIEKIDKFLKSKQKYSKTYKLHKEIKYLIIIMLVDKYKENLFSEDVNKILFDRRFKKFFDRDLINFAQFYLSGGYKLSSGTSKSTLLHNIYYRYLSKSYKNVLKLLKNHNIVINYLDTDARNIKSMEFSRYDIIFLDAFTPSLSPSLWTVDFIKELYNRLSYDGVVITYSNSASVRNAFLKNNFYVGKIYNSQEKRFTGTIAAKKSELIKYPLNEYDSGLLKTKAGVVYRDNNLNLSNEAILEQREIDIQNSNLPSTSSFIRNFKGDKNAI